MDNDHYEKLKHQAKATRDRKITKAREEYQEAMTSIDNVRRLEKELGIQPTSRSNGQAGVPRGALAAAVRQSLSVIRGEFTSETVMRAIETHNPDAVTDHRASIASALRKLVEDGTLEVVVQPQGRRAGRYRLKETRDDVDAEEGLPVAAGSPTT